MSGFESPNHTQVPNDLFDVHLQDLGYAELKILLAILRQTLGFHRKHKRMSITDLEKATGLARSSIQKGCEILIDRKLVDRIKDGGVTVWVVNWKDMSPDMAVLGVPETGIPETDTVPETDTDYTGKPTSPIPETATPSIKERTKEKVKEKILFSYSQDDWVATLAAIAGAYYPKGYASPSSDFHQKWKPTYFSGEENGRYLITCQLGEDQRSWLEDRGKSIAENFLRGILGRRVQVAFVTEDLPLLLEGKDSPP